MMSISKSWNWTLAQCPSTIGWMKPYIPQRILCCSESEWSVHTFVQAVLTNVMFNRSCAHAWFNLQNHKNSKRNLCHQTSAQWLSLKQGGAGRGWGASGMLVTGGWVSENPSSQTHVMCAHDRAWIMLKHSSKHMNETVCLGWGLWMGVPPGGDPTPSPWCMCRECSRQRSGVSRCHVQTFSCSPLSQ